MSLWPAAYDPHAFECLRANAAPAARAWLEAHTADHHAEALEAFHLPLALQVQRWRREQQKPLLLGLAGAQGSGKSTLAQLLRVLLERGFDFRIAIVSLDDLYLPRSRRQELGRTIHPLFATRGVPGTHDVELGLDILRHLQRLEAGKSMRIPRFDKASDDRLPIEQWETVAGPLDVILFEGWCVGARAQPEYALKIAVNTLEEGEDDQLTWRTHVNRHLASNYAELFALPDRLVYLQAPSWESVYRWRRQQERQLAATTPPESGEQIMDDARLRRFVAHYERITRLMLATMPQQADLCVALDGARRIESVRIAPETSE